jgi:hypothetical protein
LKGIFPILNFFTDFGKLVKNTVDETRDTVVGEENNRDKADRFHYFVKMTPGIRGVAQFSNFFTDEETMSEYFFK